MCKASCKNCVENKNMTPIWPFPSVNLTRKKKGGGENDRKCILTTIIQAVKFCFASKLIFSKSTYS